jgi:hypothetical protein
MAFATPIYIDALTSENSRLAVLKVNLDFLEISKDSDWTDSAT